MSTAALTLLTGPWAARAVTAAVRLGVFDELAAGPATPDELATRLGLHRPGLERLLRLLTGFGLLRTDPAGHALTEDGAPLTSGHPRSVRLLAEFYEEDHLRAAWDDLEAGLRTGDTPFAVAHGRPVFEHLAGAPEQAARYTAAMAAGSRFGDRLPAAVDLSAARCVVDVGGGDGGVLAALLTACPQLSGVLLDRPEVAGRAGAALRGAGVADRVQIVGADFFEAGAVPQGADVYLLSRILHNWSDDRCRALLNALRVAAGPGGRVLVVERMVRSEATDGPDGLLPLLFDLHMLVMTQGRERTEDEYAALLAGCGFVAAPAVALPLGFSVVTGTPAGGGVR
ncbi:MULTISPECIES: methyltransferase [Pseudonocardia]|uniref:Multifunctional cyclase-dehydratase-3-O-methyl transferase TcmN n=2 Tax=Pseudonocardia TaxID=1847 RepID=A0A1Y2N0Y8_PSEAH|nr:MULTISPECIES: methyltransferase [Pseudonocardia]OSY40839.1 Multifunctional cyclase-dehydratase-3-O-methyl transferase TcmN [Pseudonocardia autotrophica]TDN71853.1 methyltransferase family protein [Pseudonocardia autotrophica]BBG02541.1 hydroxyneurosporene-O-methyltransferase [Pseudonocardia autotrophica]GEC29304.1 hydroxyneurosporene-O-methyltransferase [Pseudonocardia saturnea]